MIQWRSVIFWVIPIVIFGLVVGIVSTFIPRLDQPATATIRRSDAVYTTIIESRYPSMVGTFTISRVTIPIKDWVVVEIKSNSTGDKLRSLLYDPLNGARGIKLVVAPSKTYSPYSIVQDVGVAIPQAASEELLP